MCMSTQNPDVCLRPETEFGNTHAQGCCSLGGGSRRKPARHVGETSRRPKTGLLDMNEAVDRYRHTNKLKNSILRQLVSSRFIVPSLVAATLVLLPCILVWQNVYVMNLVKEVSVLEKENKTLQDAIKKRRAEIIDLSRLSRIESVAAEELHMKPIKSENMYTLTVDRSLEINGGVDEVVESLKKFADHLPVVSETRAANEDLFDDK